MLGYLSADIICSEKRTVFRERSLRKTVSFEEQIMSNYVYYPSVLKIGEYPQIFPSFSWGIFVHVTRLDQSRASENIWWIIMSLIITDAYLQTVSSVYIPEWFSVTLHSDLHIACKCQKFLIHKTVFPPMQKWEFIVLQSMKAGLVTEQEQNHSDPWWIGFFLF